MLIDTTYDTHYQYNLAPALVTPFSHSLSSLPSHTLDQHTLTGEDLDMAAMAVAQAKAIDVFTRSRQQYNRVSVNQKKNSPLLPLLHPLNTPSQQPPSTCRTHPLNTPAGNRFRRSDTA